MYLNPNINHTDENPAEINKLATALKIPIVNQYRYLGCTITRNMSPNTGIMKTLSKIHFRFTQLKPGL
jgi:hypothetical protein